MYNAPGECHICKKEYTSMHVEIKPGLIAYVCPVCLEKSKNNFVWLCVNCGRTYFRPKELVLNRLKGYGVENTALLGESMQLILGIDICVACDPEGIVEYVNGEDFELSRKVCSG